MQLLYLLLQPLLFCTPLRALLQSRTRAACLGGLCGLGGLYGTTEEPYASTHTMAIVPFSM